MARAVAEGIRRANAQAADEQARGCLGCVLVTAIFAIAFIVLITWNPGG